ncbi:MAG: ATP-binding cassette domain-containing protein [Syntrophobacteraceae bacterium]|nr:ATP-binding cassette domain-containing protein [Syntrophobacteraceae bacterium]
MPILETDALTRRFGDHAAVDGVSLSLDAGEVFGLLGPNGAGKTTMIKMLTTLLPPTAGSARVAGFDIARSARAVRRVIGYVPQLVSADGSLSGYENLLIFAKLYDIPRSERSLRISEALSFVGLLEAASRLVREYSGGMIRRLEIAQAVLHRPRVLFLDEPTVGLDPVGRRAVWDHIESLRKDFGTTIFLTTHLMEEAQSLCTMIAIMHRGRVAAIGRPDELKASVGENGTTLDDVFVHYAGDRLDSGGGYRETSRTRRTARRLG